MVHQVSRLAQQDISKCLSSNGAKIENVFLTVKPGTLIPVATDCPENMVSRYLNNLKCELT